MQKLTLLLTFMFFVGCASKQSENSESRFKKFIGSLPARNLPLDFSCGLPDGPSSDNLHSSEFSDYAEFIRNDQNLIFGVIGQSSEFTLIIYGESGDDLYPSLYSYNKLGTRIDSLFLILSGCGGADESVIPSSTVSIDQKLQIVLTDTLKYIHYLGNRVYVSDSLKTTSVHYSVDKDGRIIRMN